jgi:threonylcarbamoyladenosine tRNA methylthiotransferase MtaB
VRHFSISTLGCRANQADSARLRAILLSAGLEERPAGEPVDCAIVNTCTVTVEADRKSRQLLTKALRVIPEAGQVVATGCAVAGKGGLKQLPGAVLRLPPEQRESLLTLLKVEACPGREADPAVHRTTRALLKIQDGCDQFCTFCIVPYVRGRSQSVPIDEVVAQAVALEAQGYGEIVLTGIHLSIWGHDLPGNPDLSHLAAAILGATRSVRLRLASVEPDRFPLALLDLMADQPRLCPYLHLVLQHASDRILEKMHRGYTLASYSRIVEEFFAKVPQATLSSDIMVGFPGETESDFAALVRYLRATPFYHLHVFPYSSRPGTAASKFSEQVPGEVKKRRRDIILRLGERKKVEALRAMIGAVTTVVFEGDHRPGWLKGTTHNGMTLVAKAGPVLRKRQAQVTVTRRLGANLVGQVEATV